ncbi:haloacid dehalogenase-like hydrolase [Xylariomycetidae sp. FL0641]|nr:haloacid dehalogenase-like hydrolase [Xylariomycetidae sp. FL0641]
MRRFLSTSISNMAKASPRRFAPLKESTNSKSDLPRLQGIVFDVDGTLCEPQNHMFTAMRSVLGIPKSRDILEHVYSLPSPAAQERAMESIRAIERESMAAQVAQPGLVELMRHLDARGVRKGICTRNFEQPVAHLLAKFLRGVAPFAPIVTRDFRPPKPDPAGILFIARSWGLTTTPAAADPARHQAVLAPRASADDAVDAAEKRGAVGTDAEGRVEEVGDAAGLIMVGDSADDMTAGRRAGAATVLLVNEANKHLAEHAHTDLVIERLDELIGILDDGFVGRTIPSTEESG